jgi:Fe-S-cluster containining protein
MLRTPRIEVERPSIVRDFDKLSRWTKFSPRLCKGCFAACCRLPVEASSADLLRLGVVHENELEGSLKKVAKRLESMGIIKFFRASSGKFTLAQTSSGDCLFLGSDRRCTVYDKRPDVCRKFPEIGPKPGFCPSYPHSGANSSKESLR